MAGDIRAIAELMFGPDPTPDQIKEAKYCAFAYLYGGGRPPSDVDVIEGEYTERSTDDTIPKSQLIPDGRTGPQT